jgi:hypothetical protein
VQGMGQVIPEIHINITVTQSMGLILKGKGIARLSYVSDENCFIGIFLIYLLNDLFLNSP